MTANEANGPAQDSSTSTSQLTEMVALARDFQDFSEQAFTRLPLYRRITEGVAGDPDVVRRLMLAPIAQRVPNLLLASVHDVLLEGLDDLLADWLIMLDPLNPQTTARMCSAFQTWKRYDADRQSLIKVQLERIMAQPNLSRDTSEMVSRILAQ